MTIRVSNALMRGRTAIIRFDGDRYLHFVPSEPIGRNSPRLATVAFYHQNRRLVTFNPLRRQGQQTRETGFTQMSSGLTPLGFAQYWRAALDFVGRRQTRLPQVWSVLSLDNDSLKQIEAGSWSRPTPRP